MPRREIKNDNWASFKMKIKQLKSYVYGNNKSHSNSTTWTQ